MSGCLGKAPEISFDQSCWVGVSHVSIYHRTGMTRSMKYINCLRPLSCFTCSPGARVGTLSPTSQTNWGRVYPKQQSGSVLEVVQSYGASHTQLRSITNVMCIFLCSRNSIIRLELEMVVGKRYFGYFFLCVQLSYCQNYAEQIQVRMCNFWLFKKACSFHLVVQQ